MRNTFILQTEEGVTKISLCIIYVNILYKGHGKEKTLDASYRTISMCPLIAKSLDVYIIELSSPDWEAVQAETQFQGKDMSHEMAAHGYFSAN